MLTRILFPMSGLLVITVWLFAGSAAALDVSPRCEAELDRTAGHYSKCLLGADASHARHGNPAKLEKHQDRCEARFHRRADRAIRRHGADACPSSELVAAMGDRTVTYAEGVSTEAEGTPYTSLLFVQNATGGTLTQATLTLTGVSPQTGWFTDRPYRNAGQNSTAGFILFWNEGVGFFVDAPPNADFTCEVGDEVVNYVVELTEPYLSWDGSTLTYAISAVGDTTLPEELECDSDSHLFIDGLPSCSITGHCASATALLNSVNETYHAGLSQPHRTHVTVATLSRDTGEVVDESEVEIVQVGERAAMFWSDGSGGGFHWEHDPEAQETRTISAFADSEGVTQIAAWMVDHSQFESEVYRRPQVSDEIPKELLESEWKFLQARIDVEIDDQPMWVVQNTDLICWNADTYTLPGGSTLWVDPQTNQLRRIVQVLHHAFPEEDLDPADVDAHRVVSLAHRYDIMREEVASLTDMDFASILSMGDLEDHEDRTAEIVTAEKRHRADRTTRCDALKTALAANR
jgi:hypothetical protein